MPNNGLLREALESVITIEDIIDYVMTSPENTNANILREMLNQLAENSGSETILA